MEYMSTVQLEDAFVQEIYGRCLDDKGMVDLNRFKSECESPEYNGSLDFLLRAYSRKIEEVRNVLLDSPIGESGDWKNFGELKNLEHTWSDLEMGEILDWGYKPFKQRTENRVLEYWVDYSSLHFFVSSDKFECWKKASNDLADYSGIVKILEEEIESKDGKI